MRSIRKYFLIFSAALFFFSSCATMFKGSASTVSIKSVPAGAQVAIDGQIMGKTPLDILLDNNADHSVQFLLEGYLPQTVVIKSIVDKFAGKYYHLDQESLNITLAPAKKQEPATPEKPTETVNMLMTACAAGDLKAVEIYLKGGMSPNYKDNEGVTPLMLSVMLDNAALAGLLIAKGANVNSGEGANRPLALALKLGRHSIAELLIEKGASDGTDPAKKHWLVVNIEPKGAGIVLLTPTLNEYGTFKHNEVIKISTGGAENYTFKGWSGANAQEIKNGRLIMNSDKEITALFEKSGFDLNIAVEPAGAGEIILNPATDASGIYLKDQEVELTPKSLIKDFVFAKWTGLNAIDVIDNKIKMDARKFLKAVFVPKPPDQLFEPMKEENSPAKNTGKNLKKK